MRAVRAMGCAPFVVLLGVSREPLWLWNHQPPFVADSAVNFNAAHNDYHYDFGCSDAVGQINFISYLKRSSVYNSWLSANDKRHRSHRCRLPSFVNALCDSRRMKFTQSSMSTYLFWTFGKIFRYTHITDHTAPEIIINSRKVSKYLGRQTHSTKFCLQPNAHARSHRIEM